MRFNKLIWPRLKSGVSRKGISMTVKIRLKRVGKRKQPSYRIVVADSRSPRDGRIIENLGWYNPLVEPSAINVNEEKVLGRLNNGAQPTESVVSLLKRVGVMDRFEQTKAAASHDKSGSHDESGSYGGAPAETE